MALEDLARFLFWRRLRRGGDPIMLVLLDKMSSGDFIERAEVLAMYVVRDRYYALLGAYLWPDCFVPDWRVAEVAVAFDIPIEVAIQDAITKGFMLR